MREEVVSSSTHPIYYKLHSWEMQTWSWWTALMPKNWPLIDSWLTDFWTLKDVLFKKYLKKKKAGAHLMTSVCSCDLPSVIKGNQAKIKSFKIYFTKRKCSVRRQKKSLRVPRKRKLFLLENIRRLHNTQLKTQDQFCIAGEWNSCCTLYVCALIEEFYFSLA